MVSTSMSGPARDRPQSDSAGALLEAVAFAANRLVAQDRGPGDIDPILQRLVCAAGADRASLFQRLDTCDGDVHVSLRREYTSGDVTPLSCSVEPDDLPLTAAGLGRWVGSFDRRPPPAGDRTYRAPHRRRARRPRRPADPVGGRPADPGRRRLVGFCASGSVPCRRRVAGLGRPRPVRRRPHAGRECSTRRGPAG